MGAAFGDEDDEITAINVTPLVDIVLVLLIIFMVTTSVINEQEGLGVEKPEASTGGKLDDAASVLLVCKEDGSTMVDGKPAPDDDAVEEAIVAALAKGRENKVEVQGVVVCDEQAQVGKMVHLIDLMRAAGVKKYAIATKKPQAAGS